MGDLTDQTELTTFSGDEVFYVVEDDDGTPAPRKVTIENLAAGVAGRSEAQAILMPKSGGTFTGDISVPDEVYDATAWNGSTEVPTKNALRDKIEALAVGSVSDAAYSPSWDGDTTTAPSKNAVYDAFLPQAGYVVKVKTANEGPIVNTTLQDDDHLFFSIAANETWLVRFNLFVHNTGTTGDVKLACTVPSGATTRTGIQARGLADDQLESGTLKDQSYSPSTTALTGGLNNTAQPEGNWIEYVVYVENGATPGTVQLQWAENTTDATNGTTLYEGSWMEARRVPF